MGHIGPHVTLNDPAFIHDSALLYGRITIGAGSSVAGHAIVPKGKTFSENSVLAGVPAKKIGERDGSRRTLMNARLYSVIASNYAAGVERLSDEQLALLTGHAEGSPET